MLPLPYKTVNLVSDSDLDTYIEKHLGKPWSCQQNDFCSNDSLITFDVGGWVYDEEEKAKVAAWINTPTPTDKYHGVGRFNDEGVSTDSLLSELLERGLLPEGELHVHVSW